MGKAVQKFDIVFSNPNGAFYAGQPVTGKVIVEVEETIKIRGVELKFIGEAYVNFSDGKLKKSHTENIKYFEQVDLIFGSNSSALKLDSSATVLNQGIHEFPFVFNLPTQCPSSFESTLGHVRYFCKAYLHRPWKFDFTSKQAFTVVGVLNLTNEPAAFTPAYRHIEKTFSFFDRLLYCMKGGLSIILNLERCAYVPGESILISADINNNSSNRVKSVEAYLQQNIMFEAKGVQRFCRGQTKLGLVIQGSVIPGQAQYWRQEALKIPALPPTKLAGCKLITVDYIFNFILYIENASNIVINIPIVIGTIPLTNQQNIPPPRPPPPIATATPSAPIYEPSPRPAVFPSAPVLPDLSLLPPPAYEECMDIGQVNIQDSDDNQFTYGQMTYRPLYPTYNPRHSMPA